MIEILGLAFLVFSAYTTGVFWTETRLAGKRIQRGEIFTGLLTAWMFSGLALRLTLTNTHPAAMLWLPVGAVLITGLWVFIARRARKGARPGGPLPK